MSSFSVESEHVAKFLYEMVKGAGKDPAEVTVLDVAAGRNKRRTNFCLLSLCTLYRVFLSWCKSGLRETGYNPSEKNGYGSDLRYVQN